MLLPKLMIYKTLFLALVSRCRYLSSEREIILSVHDEMSAMPEGMTLVREIQFSSLDVHVFSLKRVCVLMGSPFPSLFTLLYPWVWTFVTCRISVIFFASF